MYFSLVQLSLEGLFVVVVSAAVAAAAVTYNEVLLVWNWNSVSDRGEFESIVEESLRVASQE